MDTLVEDVFCVMKALDTHGAGELINANVVFERLETLSANGMREDLVNSVVHSFLVDLGMAPPNEADSEEIVVLSESPKKLDRRGIVRELDDSPEVCVLSPGVAQAFEEPFSPCPLDLTPTTLDIKGEVSESVSERISLPNVAPSSYMCIGGPSSPISSVMPSSSITSGEPSSSSTSGEPSLSSEKPSSFSTSGKPSSSSTSGKPTSSRTSGEPSSSSTNGELSSSSTSAEPSSSSASEAPSSSARKGSHSSSHSHLNGRGSSSHANVTEEHNYLYASEKPSSSSSNGEPSASVTNRELKPSDASKEPSFPEVNKAPMLLLKRKDNLVKPSSLGAIPKRMATNKWEIVDNTLSSSNGMRSEVTSGFTNGAASIKPAIPGSLVSSPSKRGLSEPSSEKKRLRTSPEKELQNDEEYFNSLFNISNSKPDALPATSVTAESRTDSDHWDIEPQNFGFLGAASKPKSSAAAKYVATLSDMFPQADPQYLWDQCDPINDEEAFNALIVSMLSGNYPRFQDSKESKRNISSAAGSERDLKQETPSSSLPKALVVTASTTSVSSSASNAASSVANTAVSVVAKTGSSIVTPIASLKELKKRMSTDDLTASGKVPEAVKELWQDKLDFLVQILPDADPSFLEEKARELFENEDQLRQFVADSLENKDYPSRKDWLWRQEQLALQKKYTEEFSIPNFLEAIPDPFTYFTDEKRKCTNKNQANMFLRNKYRKLKIADIVSTYTNNKFNLTLTCRALERWTGPTMKGRRNQVDWDITKNDNGKGIDVPFLQEIAFIENEHRIVDYLENKKIKREEAFNEAKSKGELIQCQCCYDDEVLLEDVRTCTEGHIFCLSCMQKSSEQRIGDGHTTFPCLEDCSSEFSLQTLQEILKPTVFSRLVQRKQVEEVKAAGIDDLVQCPFCDFCNIPPKEDKVFRCLNPDCMKESCRLCKEDSHVPLRCDEVEKKSDVEMRTYIENKMTEALVRTCWKCQKKFVKEDGCNKMTCQCGALMCYICRQPVKDYSHFNGQGGEAFNKCPLWSHNDDLHVAAVAKVAAEAKQEVLTRDPEARLVHDPTAVLPKATGKAPAYRYGAHAVRGGADVGDLARVQRRVARYEQQLNALRVNMIYEPAGFRPEYERVRANLERYRAVEAAARALVGRRAPAAAAAAAAARPAPAAAAAARPAPAAAAAARPAPAAAAAARPAPAAAAAARPAPAAAVAARPAAAADHAAIFAAAAAAYGQYAAVPRPGPAHAPPPAHVPRNLDGQRPAWNELPAPAAAPPPPPPPAHGGGHAPPPAHGGDPAVRPVYGNINWQDYMPHLPPPPPVPQPHQAYDPFNYQLPFFDNLMPLYPNQNHNHQ